MDLSFDKVGDEVDYAYHYGSEEIYGDYANWNITEQDCLDFCEWKRQTLDWTRFAACEWSSPGIWSSPEGPPSPGISSMCTLYGNSGHCASGGNKTGLHFDIFCYTYDTDGCPGT